MIAGNALGQARKSTVVMFAMAMGGASLAKDLGRQHDGVMVIDLKNVKNQNRAVSVTKADGAINVGAKERQRESV